MYPIVFRRNVLRGDVSTVYPQENGKPNSAECIGIRSLQQREQREGPEKRKAKIFENSSENMDEDTSNYATEN